MIEALRMKREAMRSSITESDVLGLRQAGAGTTTSGRAKSGDGTGITAADGFQDLARQAAK